MKDNECMCRTSTGKFRNREQIGLVYGLLLLFTCISICGWLVLAGLFALVIAFFLRRKSRVEEDVMGVVHANWQIHTVLIFIGIVIIGIVAVCGLIVYIALEPLLMDQISAIIKSDAEPVAKLRLYWKLNISVVAAAIFAVLYLLALVWTLMRTIKGLIAFFTNTVPGGWGVRHWSALIVATALQYFCWRVFF